MMRALGRLSPRLIRSLPLALLAVSATAGDERPPLEGSVETSPDDTPRAYCEEFSEAVDPAQGTLEIMPKAGQGNRDFCLAPRPGWALLGEDREHCCFFAPHDWAVQYPPLPGNIDVDQPPPDRRPSPEDPKLYPQPGPHDPGPPQDGSKGVKRTPGRPPQPDPVSLVLTEAVDACLDGSVPGYVGPDWSRIGLRMPPAGKAGAYERSFVVSAVAADRALDLDEAAHGTWQDRERWRDYLIGWLTHCLTKKRVLPDEEPRIPYARFLRSQSPSATPARLEERETAFFDGYRIYHLPPFGDTDTAGPPSPDR